MQRHSLEITTYTYIIYIMPKINIKITIFCQFLGKYYRNVILYFDVIWTQNANSSNIFGWDIILDLND